MTQLEKLNILRNDLQRPSKSQDDYLKALLGQAEALLERQGVYDDGTYDYSMLCVDYASFLFRKRADPNMNMPRFLRHQIMQILTSQKLRGVKKNDI